MKRELRVILPVAAALLAAGCTNAVENVMFVTSSVIGIDADLKKSNIAIGYDRTEVVVGPVYVDTGGVPPVAASLQSNLSILEPHIGQVFATGNAALAVTRADKSTDIGDANKLTGTKRAMAFGTTSSVGLKVDFVDSTPTAVSFGYKRRELSIIPLHQQGDTNTTDKYTSALAAINLDTTIATQTNTGIALDQFFATGAAAEKLGENENIRKIFEGRVKEVTSAAARKGIELAETQAHLVSAIVACVQKDSGTLADPSKQRLAALVDAAKAEAAIPDESALKGRTTTDALVTELKLHQQSAITPMSKAITKITCA